MSEGKIKKKLNNLFLFCVGTLFVVLEDSLTIEYNERALSPPLMSSRHRILEPYMAGGT